jgi:hypothetical protein
MSYSISVRAASKAALKEAAMVYVTNYVASQQPHADRDVEMVRNTINGMVDSLDEPSADQEIALECYGSIGGNWGADSKLAVATSNNITCKAYHAPKAST